MPLHYKERENETIPYVDIMSLYPYICKYFKFPIGHPITHIGDDCKNIEACLRMECLIKFSIVPPEKLYHPVLLFRCDNNLMLCLCRMCVLTSSSVEECVHNRVEDRTLTGTWVMDKVRLTVKKRYRILEIYEVYEYQVTQYDLEIGESGHCVANINRILNLKAEASGYLGWVYSAEDEDRYVDSFWQNEGTQLDKEANRYNAAKLGLDKFCLNPIWGKLTERNDRTMKKIITESNELFGFLSTPSVEVTKLAFGSVDVVNISWNRGAEEGVPNLPNTNEVIGDYVTAGAGIHLYRYLDRLGENAMYCDKYSVIYIQPSGEPSLIESGDNLGDITSELRSSDTIKEFVSGEAKNYAYRVLDTGEVNKRLCAMSEA